MQQGFCPRPTPRIREEGYTSQASEEVWRRRVYVDIKIEAGSTVTEPVRSLEPGAWYSLSWLWCGDTFLGVEHGALQQPASLLGRLLALLGPLSSEFSACPSTRNLTGRVDLWWRGQAEGGKRLYSGNWVGSGVGSGSGEGQAQATPSGELFT